MEIMYFIFDRYGSRAILKLNKYFNSRRDGLIHEKKSPLMALYW